ncbi:hypothetical protein EDE15_2371 [Edaphobacter aggregans]|uniref:DUF3592 domain-containing protein n=1 Tax=Edaphobacter aggregans TaxID=570835 RepID=A0A428MJ07_9BACT|nr:hypothetical protein [Edaphobacter aggregans]RSL16846.1 hypothetical protein EDE15_2371 [Edaphobacter aggregans]
MPTSLIEHALHHDWLEIEAEVCDCRFIRAKIGSRSSVGEAAHYAVGFKYEVNGITYQGVLSSPVEVRAHDKFSIRYNPEYPEENNSLASECDRGWFRYYIYILATLVIGFVVYDIARSLVFNR